MEKLKLEKCFLENGKYTFYSKIHYPFWKKLFSEGQGRDFQSIDCLSSSSPS
jgi:hypothetical protein